MKAIIEKQLIQWKEELAKHVQTRNQAQIVLEEKQLKNHGKFIKKTQENILKTAEK